MSGLGYQRAEVVLRAPVAAPLSRPRDADDAVTGVEVLARGVDGVQTGCVAAGSGSAAGFETASQQVNLPISWPPTLPQVSSSFPSIP